MRQRWQVIRPRSSERRCGGRALRGSTPTTGPFAARCGRRPTGLPHLLTFQRQTRQHIPLTRRHIYESAPRGEAGTSGRPDAAR
jgi:hypothetical protein